MSGAGTAAMWAAILIGTPLIMKSIDFSKLNNLCSMDSTVIEKQLNIMKVDDPMIRSHVMKTIHDTLSGDCRTVMKKTLAMIEKSKAEQANMQSLSIDMPAPDNKTFIDLPDKDFTNQ